MATYSNNDIRNINEDWSLDERLSKPYSGRSVQAFIKRMLNSKGGDFYFDASTSRYLIFADTASRERYLSNREEYADLLLGSFDAPSNYTVEINMTTPANNVILRGSTGNYIRYTFDIKNKNGTSTGEAVSATYTFNNGGNVQRVTQVYSAGTSVEFLVDDYLLDGLNAISVVIQGRSSMASTMAATSFTVVAIELESDFSFGEPIAMGGTLGVPYHLTGAGLKYVEWYIDGVKQSTVDNISELEVRRTKSLSTSSLAEGIHSVQFHAYITNNGQNYFSQTLYFDFVVTPASGTWDSVTSYVMLGLELPAPTTDGSITIDATQYESFPYKLAVYNSSNLSTEVDIREDGSIIQTVQPPLQTVTAMDYVSSSEGSHTLTFAAGGYSRSIGVVVEGSSAEIEEVTDGLALHLDAKGRSNTEADPASWTYQGIGTSFSNFKWNSQSGWVDGALVIQRGTSIQVGYSPLESVSKTMGKTIEIDYEVSNFVDDDATVVNMTSGGTGLTIAASYAQLTSAAGVSVKTRYRSGDRLHLAFIINPTSGDNRNLVFIVNNGILERAVKVDASDSFVASQYLAIGSSDCTVSVRSIRVYNRAITPDEAFRNFAVDSSDLLRIAARNNIYGAGGSIDADKVNASIPVMIITGNIDHIMSISDKARKGEWNTNAVDIEFRNMADVSKNFTIEKGDIRLQGTSSISYPRKNFRIYSKPKTGKYNTVMRDADGNVIEGGKYAFKTGSAAVTCWCLKADYAESSGSHNTGVARLWNRLMYDAVFDQTRDAAYVQKYGIHPLRTKAQTWAAENKYPYDVRTTIDGFPIVLFQRESASAPMTCFGQYNFNNDKSTEDVYGFTALKVGSKTFDNSKVQCVEFLDSDNPIALFTDVSGFDGGWEDAFEFRYPDGSSATAALKTLCTWVNSCKDNQAKWNSEKEDHFDLPKLCAYYVYLLRFGAVDQTVKNAMFHTEDGVHWSFINYDNDTILGIDNASVLFDTWDYDLLTRTPEGGYYYAGKGKSVLWNCFMADPDCMALVKKIDAILYQAGLNYETMCQMFDGEQSGQWCERIYNENGKYKYITQAQEAGQNVLYMLQGARTSFRHWWLQHRMEKYDNMWGNGSYTERLIQVRAAGSVLIPETATYKFTPAIDSYFGYALASNEIQAATARTAGVEYTSEPLGQATGVGNLIYIYNANNIDALDLSGYIEALGTLNLAAAHDVAGGSSLRTLVLGDGVHTNAFLSAISGLTVQTGLEKLDIRGFEAIVTLSELASLPNISVFLAAGSGLTVFRPADGASLNSVSLPATIQTIDLNRVTMGASALTYTPTGTLRSLTLNNVGGAWDAKGFVNTWLAALSSSQLSAATLTLTGINWTDMTAAQVIRMGQVGTRSLQGKVTLTGITQSEYEQIVSLYGPNVFNPSGTFIIDAPESVLLALGETEIEAGTGTQATATAFPIQSGTSILYQLYNGATLVPATDGVATYGGVSLNTSTGAITTASDADATVRIRALATHGSTVTFSDYVTLTVYQITYPSSVIISGDDKLKSLGDYAYTKSFDTNNFTAQVLSVSWSLTGASYFAAITQQTDAAATVTVQVETYDAVVATLTCTVTLSKGVTLTGTKSITIKYVQEWVDLGLANGVKWATGNIIKDKNTGAYEIGSPTDYGAFFSWGNIIGYNGYEKAFNESNYRSTPGNSLTASIASNDAEHDAPRALLGEPWRLPTTNDFWFLFRGTDREWVKNYMDTGVSGIKFMKKNDHSVFVFFPAGGEKYSYSQNNEGYHAECWTSVIYSDTSKAYLFDHQENNSFSSITTYSSRYLGLPIRPVQ